MVEISDDKSVEIVESYIEWCERITKCSNIDFKDTAVENLKKDCSSGKTEKEREKQFVKR